MMTNQDIHKKLSAAFELLQGPTLSYSTFHNVHILVQGLHPEVDKRLESCSKALVALEKLQEGDVITLTAENLPEETDRDKKHKKALLFFITNIKDLKNEIQRVDTELSQTNTSMGNNAWHIGKIIKYAKGPLGVITIVAIAIFVMFSLLHKKPTKQPITVITPSPSGKLIQVITYNGKQIPLNQLRIGNPHFPNCDSTHYHALSTTETVVALDGTTLLDPGNCGFGKVKDTQVTTTQE
jgi:hypothetical protein